jgi:hypothetical protein
VRQKQKTNIKKELKSSESLSKLLKYSFIKLLVCGSFAATIFLISKFSWWLGFALFIVFSIYCLSFVLINGLVLLASLIAWTVSTKLFIKMNWGKRIELVERVLNKLSGMTAISVLTILILAGINFWLGFSLFAQ